MTKPEIDNREYVSKYPPKPETQTYQEQIKRDLSDSDRNTERNPINFTKGWELYFPSINSAPDPYSQDYQAKARVETLMDFSLLEIVEKVKKLVQLEDSVDILSVEMPEKLIGKIKQAVESKNQPFQVLDVGHISVLLNHTLRKKKPVFLAHNRNLPHTAKVMRFYMEERGFHELYMLGANKTELRGVLKNNGFELTD